MRKVTDRPSRADVERIARHREFQVGNISRFLQAQPELGPISDERLRAIAIGLMGEYCRPIPPAGGAVPLTDADQETQ